MVASLSIVVTTYEWPEALDLVLHGLADQSDEGFEVVVADDGSGSATADVVHRWRTTFADRLRHVWQPDEGFRCAAAQNLAAASSAGSYLVFIDGDCIPRRHFVRAIRRAALPGWFLAGKRVQLSRELSHALTHDPDSRPSLTMAALLRNRSELGPWVHFTPRDRRRPWRPHLPDFWPDGNEYGFLIGVSRSDLERVNGFDERFVGWGDHDVDIAVRLGRLGLRCGFAGPRTTMLHIWHESRAMPERENWHLLRETQRSDRVEAIEGLRKHGTKLESATVDLPQPAHRAASHLDG